MTPHELARRILAGLVGALAGGLVATVLAQAGFLPPASVAFGSGIGAAIGGVVPKLMKRPEPVRRG